MRDYAEVRADGEITLPVAQAALDMLKVDPEGFDALDRRLLGLIIENFDGGPVGVESLAAALSEERGTIEDVVEPYLIQQGFLMRTARGRMVSAKGWRHLGLVPPPRQAQPRRPVRVRRSAADAAESDRPTPRTVSPGRCASTGKTPTPAAWSITPLPAFLERARSEWLRALGVDQMAFKQATGLAFVVRDMQIDFLKPALLDDELAVTVDVKERRAASILFAQTITRAGRQLPDPRAACGWPAWISQRMRAGTDSGGSDSATPHLLRPTKPIGGEPASNERWTEHFHADRGVEPAGASWCC